MVDGKSPAEHTRRRRVRGRGRHDSAIACAVVTFSCMLTDPAGAPMMGPTASPTSVPIVHQCSAHARTPRVAHVSAYSARERATPRGMAPRELLIMYTLLARIGNS